MANTHADLLRNLSRTLNVLRRDMPDMPITWVLLLLHIAERPGCNTVWLSESTGLSASVTNRTLHELKDRFGGLIRFIEDPLNIKRNLFLLTEVGRQRIASALATAYGAQSFETLTLEQYNAALRENDFAPTQIPRIRTAASKKFSGFVGSEMAALRLEPVRPVVKELEQWISDHGGRWYEMPNVYPDQGGAGVADFDDPYTGFQFVLRWHLRIGIE